MYRRGELPAARALGKEDFPLGSYRRTYPEMYGPNVFMPVSNSVPEPFLSWDFTAAHF